METPSFILSQIYNFITPPCDNQDFLAQGGWACPHMSYLPRFTTEPCFVHVRRMTAPSHQDTLFTQPASPSFHHSPGFTNIPPFTNFVPAGDSAKSPPFTNQWVLLPTPSPKTEIACLPLCGLAQEQVHHQFAPSLLAAAILVLCTSLRR